MTAINHECKFTLPNQPETLKRGLSSAHLQAITLGEEQYIAKQVENHEPLDKIYSITKKAIHSALRNIRYGYYSLPNSSILPMRTCNGCKTETCSLTK